MDYKHDRNGLIDLQEPYCQLAIALHGEYLLRVRIPLRKLSLKQCNRR